MRIVIDLQGAQAENRNRGIGRYALSFTKAFIQNRAELEVYVLLNAHFGESIDLIRDELYGLLPATNICIWDPSDNIDGRNDTYNSWQREASELTREAFIAGLNPDLVLITSLFEGLVDSAVTSVKMLNSSILTAVIVYDLIPFINPDPYLNDMAVRSWYETKIKHLRRADIVLAISESSRREVIERLGFELESVVNISTAVDRRSYSFEVEPSYTQALSDKLEIDRDVVMYTGGIDHRKNIEGLIEAYSKLPSDLRNKHQLVVVCNVSGSDKERLQSLARGYGLRKKDFILTGYVSESDLIALYKLCKVFIFPSLHEGFGLPALEAMTCGKAVIASNTSSLPEVVGNNDALFDPYDQKSITDKLDQVLSDDRFRAELESAASRQSELFSWEKTAVAAVTSIRSIVVKHNTIPNQVSNPQRLRLAYISPLPPARSGISDYSAELLPELASHYQIDVIVAQPEVDAINAGINYKVRSVSWFENNSHLFDRVIYHFGNSSFHEHMFGLLERFPGTVVLHDFFLSGIVANMEVHGGKSNFWVDALYHGHGYAAVRERFYTPDTADVVWKYSCNLNILQQAQGIIVHSSYSIRLAQRWYGANSGLKWAEIPLLRVPKFPNIRMQVTAKEKLGFLPGSFIVCSFGLLGPSKLNHRLLDAWLDTELSKDENCFLVFVGENNPDQYGQDFLRKIKASGFSERIKITGWADTETFNSYLLSADVAVQLRTLSRGETSAAVLDCLNHGIATVVNANGSMSDISGSALIKLTDEFKDLELAEALQRLRKDPALRAQLGAAGKTLIRTQHSPRRSALQYHKAIERFYKESFSSHLRLVDSINDLDKRNFTPANAVVVAESIDRSLSPSIVQPQLLLDISELVNHDAKSGIQRVVRNILRQWLLDPPKGYRVEPVYAILDAEGYFYARSFTLGFLDCPDHLFKNEPVTYFNGDMFIGLDLQPQIVPKQNKVLADMRRRGVTVQFVVYDLLLKKLAHCFPEGAASLLDEWLTVITQADGAICISKSVAEELAEWVTENRPESKRPFNISWFHLGADIATRSPESKASVLPSKITSALLVRPSFLMVGTIEPRKGHGQVLEAFELSWAQGQDINLVIVGKQGWMVENLIEKINSHPENGKKLFWLEGIDDIYLAELYSRSSALIAASWGEGFGLPLIEAAQYSLPLIVRDIPVFKEVAGENAFYFDGDTPSLLKECLDRWLGLYGVSAHPASEKMSWLTWEESATQLFEAARHGNVR